jgi:predicted RNA-binding protein with PUA-like domain
VRNYQARNMMRDQMQVGDGVLFYHSQAQPMGIYGIAEIASAGYPDPTAFDPKAKYYDAKSDPATPTWMVVAVAYVAHLNPPVPLDTLNTTPGLEKMKVIQRGSRLSIQPVTPKEWEIVLNLTQQVS